MGRLLEKQRRDAQCCTRGDRSLIGPSTEGEKTKKARMIQSTERHDTSPRFLPASHVVDPILLAIVGHVRNNVNRGDVSRKYANPLLSLTDALRHLLPARKKSPLL